MRGSGGCHFALACSSSEIAFLLNKINVNAEVTSTSGPHCLTDESPLATPLYLGAFEVAVTLYSHARKRWL